MRGFDHEKFLVYQLALDFAEYSEAVIAAAQPKRRHLADQLQRAAASIALNIGEGGQEYSIAEKRRFYRIAARSAAECSAALDLYVRVRAMPAARVQAGKHMLRRIASLLVALCRSLENEERRGQDNDTGEAERP